MACEDSQSVPIAIIGIGCRFPGDITSGEKLWDMLVEKRSARTEVPSSRFNVDAFYHPDADRYGTVSNTYTLRRQQVTFRLTLTLRQMCEAGTI